MSIEAPPANELIPLISGRVKGPLGIGHLPRLWLKLRLHAVGRLPTGYRHGDGGSDGEILSALRLERDAVLAVIANERPDYMAFETWVRANAASVASPQLDAITAEFETFLMPEPRRTEWTARFGLPEYSVATRLNELDDWDLVHAQIVAPGAPATHIIPAISSSVTGPLGLVHFPRLWLKMLLHLVGRLPAEYRYGIGGFDAMVLDAIELDHDALMEFIRTHKPGYLACEAFVRERAKRLTPDAIAAINAKIVGFEVPEERAAPRRVLLGIADATVKRGVALNDVDDWLQIHHQLLASA